MEERQKQILKCVVEKYIIDAKPISSAELSKSDFSDLSSATIRNELAELENLGLIYQPHTSAGRIPTELGYRYYVQFFIIEPKFNLTDEKELQTLDLSADRESIKLLAKKTAELSKSAVFVAFSSHDVYYTGLSQLFSQPEFTSTGWAYSMSEIIDGLDRLLAKMYFTVPEEPEIRIGSNNPFGDLASSITIKPLLLKTDLMFGIIGPLRMDYRRNFGLLYGISNIINNLK